MSGRVRRVAMVGPFKPFRGGIAQFNDRLLSELVRRGNEVGAFTFSRQYPERLFPGTSQYDSDLSGPAMPVMDSLNPLSWVRSGRAIRDSKADAIIAAYWTPHLAPVLASTVKRARTPVIGLVHNAIPHDPFPLAKVLARRFLKALSAVVVLSHPVVEDLRQVGYKGRVVVSPHPVYDHLGGAIAQDEARKRLQLPPDAKVLLCFGLVRPYKGFDRAVLALTKIAEAHPDVILVIAGESYGSDLDDLLEANPVLMDRIRRFPRYIPDSEVPQFFSAADLLMLPYRRASQSGVLALAAQFELPCVVTDVGGLAEQVSAHDMGIVSVLADTSSIARAVCEALIEDRHAALKQGARHMAKALNWGTFAATVENLIDEVS